MADGYGAQDWMELAACVNDPRFTGDEPSGSVAEQMQRLCSRCDVFTECLRYHAHTDVIGVFAAGKWRSE